MSEDAAELQQVRNSIADAAACIAGLERYAAGVREIAAVVVERLSQGGKILTFGNGGSAAEALHMAEELVGRFDADRPPLPAICLAADPTLLTCIANDYGYEAVFERQVEAHGDKGDVLVVFSTSGRGEGILRAVRAARERGVVTVGLLGKGGGDVSPLVDLPLVVESDSTAQIQEVHQLIMHIVLEAVDRRFASKESGRQ